jgi:6-phosphogluconolactonase (cycloisomerase 2 family)
MALYTLVVSEDAGKGHLDETAADHSISAAGEFLYILGEISCQVSVHTLPFPGTGESKCIQRIPIYPPSDAVHLAQIPMLASALKMKDGKLLATNRQSRWPERDAIAIVGINDDASLSPPLYHWPGLTHMRELSWSPDGRFLCAAGRDAGGVVMLDRNWNVVAGLDMDNVAIQVRGNGCK